MSVNFILLITQEKAQEPLNVESFGMRLLQWLKCRRYEVHVMRMGRIDIEEIIIVVVGKITSRESLPKRDSYVSRTCSLQKVYESDEDDLTPCTSHN